MFITRKHSGAGAAVVIMPSAFGPAPDLLAQMDELAEHARVVVTFDPFARGDAGVASYDDMPRIMKRLQALDRPQAQRDLAAAVDEARRVGGEGRVIALGICFGGPFALMAAADGIVDGVATWHGTRMEAVVSRAAEMRVPMRLHFGEVDPIVPLSAVAQIRAAFADRDDVEIVVHPGATHGFTHPGAVRAYEATAERAALASVVELVRRLG